MHHQLLLIPQHRLISAADPLPLRFLKLSQFPDIISKVDPLVSMLCFGFLLSLRIILSFPSDELSTVSCRIGEQNYFCSPFQERTVRFSSQYAQTSHYPVVRAR